MIGRFEPRHAINHVVLVGVGGTGSALARSIARILYDMGRRGMHTPRYTLIDPDTVEQKNVGRQAGFAPADIGQNKALLLSKRFNLESKTRGIVPYIYHGVKGFFEAPTFHIQVEFGDMVFQDNILIVAFANFKQYGGNAIIAPFASPYDKLLDMCILNKFKFINASMNIQKLFTGNIHKLPFYRSYKFDRVKITSIDGEKIPSTIDGEYGGEDLDTYTIEVLPAKLKIRIPRKTPPGKES